ncbi:MAG TPA: hypothetical protein VGR26_15975 [Acidimicrobiales bacterium]|nr:hypothetical protein [Acidimicrobiales bacterium]
MKRALFAAITGLLLAAFAGGPAHAQEAQVFRADLQPLNDSGSTGTATVEVRGNSVTVSVQSRGTSPGLPHAQHIHIGGQNVCPPASAGGSNEPMNLLDSVEGVPFYGEVKVSLTTEGDVGAESSLAVERFPVATNGTITYQRTFDLPAGVTAADVRNGVIVQHGISELFNDQAAYDGEPRSSLNPDLPLEATIPTNCGKLVAASAQGQVGQQPRGGVASGAGGTAGDPVSPLVPAAAVGLLGAASVALIASRRRDAR